MNSVGILDSLIGLLEQAREDGLSKLPVDHVIHILDSAKVGISQPTAQMETQILSNISTNILNLKTAEEFSKEIAIENFRQIIGLGQASLRTLMLINGGAAVALLAFLGNLLSKSESQTSISLFVNSLSVFLSGIFLAACAQASTYLSQLLYSAEDPNKAQRIGGISFHWLAVLAGISSLGSFLLASWIARLGFGSL